MEGAFLTFEILLGLMLCSMATQAMEEITPNAAGDPTSFTVAVQRGNRHIVWAWADVLLAKLPQSMVRFYFDTFPTVVYPQL